MARMLRKTVRNGFLRVVGVVAMMALSLSVYADETVAEGVAAKVDTLPVYIAPSEKDDALSVDAMPVKKEPFFKRLITQITAGNVDKTHEKPIDLSFVMYPSYSHEPSFGLGGAVTALYRVDRRDSILNSSDAFLSFNASIRGFFQIYIKGNHLFPDGRSRINYVSELYRMPLNFWGIHAADTKYNEKSKYDRYQIDLQANYTYELLDNFYLGPRLRVNYSAAKDIRTPEYLHDERTHYYVTGVGFSVEYDSRDNLVSPTRGWHFLYRPTYYWRWLGSARESFLNQTAVANYYTPMWKGSVLALDLYGSFNTGKTPWTMLEMIASDGMRMRGYYMGSYMGKNQMAFQAEYRQHVYKRLGFTLWGGCATLFDSFGDFRREYRKPPILPNYGVGLRFEIKKNANVRLDCGFGRHDFGITFAFGEAF